MDELVAGRPEWVESAHRTELTVLALRKWAVSLNDQRDSPSLSAVRRNVQPSNKHTMQGTTIHHH